MDDEVCEYVGILKKDCPMCQQAAQLFKQPPHPQGNSQAIPPEVLAGISLLFDIAEGTDTCYLDEEGQANLKAVGEWYRRVKG